MGGFDKKTNRSGPKFFLALMAFMAVLFAVMWLIGHLGNIQHGRGDTEFHSLPVAEHGFIDPPKQIAIDDRSVYANNEALALEQYTCYYYEEDMLLAEADYDREGRLFQSGIWEYDAAGNISREEIQNETDGVQTRSYIYEYDSFDRCAHEKVYQGEKVVEDNYFSYTDSGRAGVSYSYLDKQMVGGISDYCSYRTEFLEDGDGNLLCAFKLKSLQVDIPNEVCKIQWAWQDDRLINRVQYYIRNWDDSGSNWYQYGRMVDMEQVNLYEYNPDTGSRNQTLQLSYVWKNRRMAFGPTAPFYRARYEGDLLLWQMDYADDGLAYFNACQYDDDGRLKTIVEYKVRDDTPYAVFYRYEYPGEDMTEVYSYSIQGQEFSHGFGDGDNVLLTFSATGTLFGIEMTDASGKLLERYEFREYGINFGKFEKMYTGTDVIAGETAILEKFGEEAESYGFRAGEDLTDNREGGEINGSDRD